MPENVTEAESTATVEDADLSAPGAKLTLELPVALAQGRAIGRVAALHHDALTGRLVGLTVRHGLLGRKFTRVPTTDLAHVSHGKVVLAHSKAAFQGLPLCGAPRTVAVKAGSAWGR